jgi:hypothetical protein
LIAGTVFTTVSKPAGQPRRGTDGLRFIVRASDVPVLAIGGITADRIDDIAAAGASGFAAVGLFIGPRCGTDEAVCGAIPLEAVVARARTRFDRVLRAP